jgi:hypothetical protein
LHEGSLPLFTSFLNARRHVRLHFFPSTPVFLPTVGALQHRAETIPRNADRFFGVQTKREYADFCCIAKESRLTQSEIRLFIFKQSPFCASHDEGIKFLGDIACYS